MRGHDVTVLQLHAKGGVRQGLDDLTFHLNGVFFGHAALRGLRGANLRINGTGNAMRVESVTPNRHPGPAAGSARPAAAAWRGCRDSADALKAADSRSA